MNHSRRNNRKKDYEAAYSYSSNLINTLHHAIKTNTIITLEYSSREKGLTRRELEPMDLITKDGRTHIVGWCRLRNDWRTFRLDRINLVFLQMNKNFVPREDYNRADFTDVEEDVIQISTSKEPKQTKKGRPNRDLIMSSSFGKTMTENKLKFQDTNETIVNYSEDEEDLAL